MKVFFRHLLTYLSLVAILASTLPAEWLHHHEEEGHCELAHEEGSVDACHLTIYHHHEGEDAACEHEAHLREQEDHCEFCQLYTAFRYEYLKPQKESIVVAGCESPQSVLILDLNTSYLLFDVLGRAPPTA